MRNKSKFSIIAILITLIAAGSVVVIQNSRSVQAQDQQSSAFDRVSYGMSGLPTGHTMRVNVTSLVQPTNELPPGPIRVVINFRNAAGHLVRDPKSGDVIRRVVMLESGESASFDLDGDSLSQGPPRFQVRPVITVQYALGVIPPDGTTEHKPFVSSVEIFNNSNPRSFIVIGSNPAVIRGFNPQPDPPVEP